LNDFVVDKFACRKITFEIISRGTFDRDANVPEGYKILAMYSCQANPFPGEAFCDAFVENNTKSIKMPSAKWKKIEKALRKALKELSADKGLLPFVNSATAKLPELRGIATSKKIAFCCDKLKVKVDDLWKKDGFKIGLKKALSLRNQLFHRAYFEDPFLLYSNRLRLQIVAERLLLKHLNWPDEKIWRWHDQELRWAVINE